MTIVETTATTGTAQVIAAEVLGRQVGVSQAGRYGTELVLPRPEAKAVAARLRASGHRARMV